MRNWRIFSILKNRNLLLAALFVLVLFSAALSMCMGSVSLSLREIAAVLSGKVTEGISASILLYARLPRTCACLLAGMALAVSGAVIQSVLSNPLAAPNIIGVNSGAGMAVTLCSAFAPGLAVYYPAAAFAGSLAAVLLVLYIAEKTGASKITLVLAGVAVSSVFGAVIDAVITFVPDALNGYSDFRIGGFANLTMEKIKPAFWIIIPSMLVLLSLTNELDVMALGSDTAQSLGLAVRRLRILFLAIAAALSGAAVSFSGLLGFVGLIVPHIIRRLIGEESKGLVTGCALGGAAMLTLCDTLSRTLFSPYELPVGIVLSLIGGPFFIWLLIQQRGGRNRD